MVVIFPKPRLSLQNTFLRFVKKTMALRLKFFIGLIVYDTTITAHDKRLTLYIY